MNKLQSIFGNNRTGHSLRAGGATALAQAGMPMKSIQAIGRWSGESYALYVRNHPVLNMKKAVEHMPQIGLTLGEQIQFPEKAPVRTRHTRHHRHTNLC
jgi:hypothetical protein